MAETKTPDDYTLTERDDLEYLLNLVKADIAERPEGRFTRPVARNVIGRLEKAVRRP